MDVKIMGSPKCPNCKVKMKILENGKKAECPLCTTKLKRLKVLVPNPLKQQNKPRPFNPIIDFPRINISRPERPENQEMKIQEKKEKVSKEIVNGIIETMNASLRKKWVKIQEISRDRLRIVWETKVMEILEKYL